MRFSGKFTRRRKERRNKAKKRTVQDTSTANLIRSTRSTNMIATIDERRFCAQNTLQERRIQEAEDARLRG